VIGGLQADRIILLLIGAGLIFNSEAYNGKFVIVSFISYCCLYFPKYKNV